MVLHESTEAMQEAIARDAREGDAITAATNDEARELNARIRQERVRAGVVEAHPDEPARYRFVHDLFREAAYESLPPGARVRLHRRILNSNMRKSSERRACAEDASRA